MTNEILEKIRISARDRKILKIVYLGKDGTSDGWREIEPYSFSGDNADDGLFAWDLSKDGIRRFSLDRIEYAELTSASFNPRYPIKIV